MDAPLKNLPALTENFVVFYGVAFSILFAIIAIFSRRLATARFGLRKLGMDVMQGGTVWMQIMLAYATYAGHLEKLASDFKFLILLTTLFFIWQAFYQPYRDAKDDSQEDKDNVSEYNPFKRP